MRIAAGKRRAQLHQIKQTFDFLLDLFSSAHAMDRQRLTNDIADRHAWIQAGIWILKDHLHFPAHIAHFFPFERGKVSTVKINMPAGWFIELQDRTPGGGFSTARLAHQPHGFTALDIK